MPKKMWAIAALLGLAAGVPSGLGGYTFLYAKGFSYMTNAPETCANCHVMQRFYDAWEKSSHRKVAVCNDCHTPHALVPKYFTKSLNGYHHSLAFTTGDFHEPIQIKARNRSITEAACRRCHANVVQEIDTNHKPGEKLSCIRCHGSVGHMY